jgi:entericidin B
MLTNSKGNTMTKIISMALIAGAIVLLGGCNTVAGAGTDISNGGQAITNKADQSK